MDVFRHRYSFRKLYRLLDQLPAGSAYWAARADDDEAADAYLLNHPKDEPRRSVVPLTEMTTTNGLLLDLYDQLTILSDRLARTMGAKPPPPEPRPRALGALQRARERAEANAQDSLMAEALAARERARKAQNDASR